MATCPWQKAWERDRNSQHFSSHIKTDLSVIHGHDEIEGGIPSVYHLVVLVLHEGTLDRGRKQIVRGSCNLRYFCGIGSGVHDKTFGHYRQYWSVVYAMMSCTV